MHAHPLVRQQAQLDALPLSSEHASNVSSLTYLRHFAEPYKTGTDRSVG